MQSEIAWMRRTDQLAEKYSAVTGSMSILELILPKDLASHRQRYLQSWESGVPQDPVFEYADHPVQESLKALDEILAEASARPDPWHSLLAQETEQFRDRYLMYATHGVEAITKTSGIENGVPDDVLLEDALCLLSTAAQPETGPLLDATRTAAVIMAVIDAEGMADWTVEIRPNMAATISVHAPHRQIRIRADASLTAERLVRMVSHEVGTHVFRWDNAWRGARLLSLGLSGSTATEEGLAVWHERQVAPESALDRRFALRVVASRAALSGGFTDVVRALLPYTDLRKAFDITARVKRGLRDTAGPGAFLKDHVYLAGLRNVERHLAAAPEDYEALMSCKWRLNLLPLAKEAGLPWREQRPVRSVGASLADQVQAHLVRAL